MHSSTLFDCVLVWTLLVMCLLFLIRAILNFVARKKIGERIKIFVNSGLAMIQIAIGVRIVFIPNYMSDSIGWILWSIGIALILVGLTIRLVRTIKSKVRY